MQEDTANPGGTGGGFGGFAQTCVATLEPLAQELRRTEPKSDERERAVAHVTAQVRSTINGMNRATPHPFAGITPAGQWTPYAAPMLCCWPQLHGPLQTLENAITRLQRAVHAATGELEQVMDLAADRWWQEAMAAPVTAVDAWWLAEQWSLAMEAAWDERLQAETHADTLHELQHSREELRRTIGSALDAVATAVGLPGPGAVSDLEAAVDRLDRAQDREMDALRTEVNELREEVRQLRRDRNHRD